MDVFVIKLCRIWCIMKSTLVLQERGARPLFMHFECTPECECGSKCENREVQVRLGSAPFFAVNVLRIKVVDFE